MLQAHTAVASISTDPWLLAQTLISGLAVGAVYALVGVGYNIVFSATRVFNLAQGQILMLGVMFTYQFRQIWGWPTVLAIAAGAILAGLANVLVEKATVAPLTGRHSYGHHSLGALVTTLGASIIIVNLAVRYWGPDALPFRPYFPISSLFSDLIVTWQQIFMVVAACAVVFGYHAFTKYTRWGTGLLAMAEDSDAAALRGVPIANGRSLAFFLGGLASGIGGAIIGPVSGANPALGFEFGLKGFVAIAIGGFGSPIGALAGGMTLGITEAAMVSYGDDSYRTFASLGLLLLVLLIRPQGLVGRGLARQV